ncbi:UNVERIFIED_CONTAM: hypothetical protein K2H54_034461 [Gekko kuhli]
MGRTQYFTVVQQDGGHRGGRADHKPSCNAAAAPGKEAAESRLKASCNAVVVAAPEKEAAESQLLVGWLGALQGPVLACGLDV